MALAFEGAREKGAGTGCRVTLGHFPVQPEDPNEKYFRCAAATFDGLHFRTILTRKIDPPAALFYSAFGAGHCYDQTGGLPRLCL